jgi:hypothetical protein
VLGACPADDCPDNKNFLRREIARRRTRRGERLARTLAERRPFELLATRPNVLDYAYARPNPDVLHAAGIIGVSRYISDSTKGKNITAAEYDGYLAAGVAVALNWENTSQDFAGGAARGRTYGARARAMARQLGHPDERPIIASIDTSVDPGALPAAIDYIVGFIEGSEVGPDFRCGCYATRFVLDNLIARALIRVAWQPLPPSSWYGNGTRCPQATMYQLGSQSYPQFTFAYDENELNVGVVDYGQHPKPVQSLPQPAGIGWLGQHL